jgi:hypothetical protein
MVLFEFDVLKQLKLAVHYPQTVHSYFVLAPESLLDIGPVEITDS